MRATTNGQMATTTKPIRVSKRRLLVMLFIGAFVVFWILFPLRHVLYEGMNNVLL